MARAAAAAGTAMRSAPSAASRSRRSWRRTHRRSSSSTGSGAASGSLQLVERANSAGATALILTLDWTFAHRRDWGSPAIPVRLDWRTMLRFAPQGVARPRWLLEFLRHGGLPDLTVPNLAAPGEQAPTFFGAYGEWMQTPLPTWADVAWLRERWRGPFVVKGVMRADDARRAVEAGADAIAVSNHGGNNLDGTPASIRALPAVVEAVGDEVEVLFDGGIRRGSDVVKALALGARAVLIGRAYLWGLAANGEAGVTNVLEILRSGVDESLIGLGRASIHDLVPDDLIVPPDFARSAPRDDAEAPAGSALFADPRVPGGG